ncbi:MAG TPA: hypothetical protein VMA53_07190 [Stellaceae bacterium]|nr:hypothetical protein [Stellaceae bacterium]
MKGSVWTVRPDDLRRVAAHAEEPERQRKLLALAQLLEDAASGNDTDSGDTPAGTRNRAR